MSIKCIDKVWDKSKQDGSNLLLLLAIADNANHDGYAWPSVSELAKKARMSDRQIKRNIQALVDSGELYVEHGVGRTNSNRYLVLTGLEENEIKTVLQRYFHISSDKLSSVVANLKGKKKDDNVSPFNKEKKGGIDGQNGAKKVTEPKRSRSDQPDQPDQPEASEPEVEKGDISTRKGDIGAGKGDISSAEKVTPKAKKGDIYGQKFPATDSSKNSSPPDPSGNRHEEEPSNEPREGDRAHAREENPPTPLESDRDRSNQPEAEELSESESLQQIHCADCGVSAKLDANGLPDPKFWRRRWEHRCSQYRARQRTASGSTTDSTSQRDRAAPTQRNTHDSIADSSPGADVYHSVFGFYPIRGAPTELLDQVVTDKGTEHVKEVLTEWLLRGYNAGNFRDIKDVIYNGWREKDAKLDEFSRRVKEFDDYFGLS
ncbi:MAG: helix-turn-helix domain-containing protein [Acidobacteriota bacterium]